MGDEIRVGLMAVRYESRFYATFQPFAQIERGACFGGEPCTKGEPGLETREALLGRSS